MANHVYHTADEFVFIKLLLVLKPFYGALSGTTRYQKKHSSTHLSWSSTFPYQLLPSTMIHSILPLQFTCLTVFLHNLSPSPLWSTSWSGALHFTLHICFSPNPSCYITTKNNTRLTTLCLGLHGWASTRKVKPICILRRQERQWVAVTSAGPYASLHLT